MTPPTPAPTLEDLARQLEAQIRAEAKAAGRGPRGLALNALATDAWKLRASLVALAAGELPELGA